MKFRSILLRTSLTIAILISLGLSWLIWTNNARFERSQIRETPQSSQIETGGELKDVYAPTKILISNRSQLYSVYNSKESIMHLLSTEMGKWNVGRFTQVENHLSTKQYEKILNQKNRIQLVYQSNITYSLLRQLFDKRQIPEQSNFNFNRMMILEKDNGDLVIQLLNDDKRDIYEGKIRNYDVKKIRKIVNSANIKRPVKLQFLNNKLKMFYEQPVKVKPYSYLVNSNEDNYYVTSLLDTDDPSSIETKTHGHQTIYYDSVYRKLTVDRQTGSVQFENYTNNNANTPTNLSATKRFTSSYTELKHTGNTLTNMRYYGLNKAKNEVTYREYIEGFPIFDQTNSNTYAVKITKSGRMIRFSNSNLEVPVPTKEQSVTLPKTATVIEDLVAQGYDKAKIQDIQIGYQKAVDPTNNKVVNLQPTYYFEYQNKWQPYQAKAGDQG